MCLVAASALSFLSATVNVKIAMRISIATTEFCIFINFPLLFSGSDSIRSTLLNLPAEQGRLEPALREESRQRPTFPRGRPRSIISAEGLNYRVRDGYGWVPFAIATGKFFA